MVGVYHAAQPKCVNLTAPARGFAARGAAVALIDIKGAPDAAYGVASKGGKAQGFALDVRDAKGWSALVAEVRAKFGSIDILVSNAGIAVPGHTVDEVDEDLWDSIVDINAKGVWLGMKAVLPTMIANKRGKICNVTSTATHIGLKNAAAYCASKGAVAGPDPASRRAITSRSIRCPRALR